jgi:hypothetical protein
MPSRQLCWARQCKVCPYHTSASLLRRAAPPHFRSPCQRLRTAASVPLQKLPRPSGIRRAAQDRPTRQRCHNLPSQSGRKTRRAPPTVPRCNAVFNAVSFSQCAVIHNSRQTPIKRSTSGVSAACQCQTRVCKTVATKLDERSQCRLTG